MSRGHRSWTHDAMTEAPGRKNDAHLSSVPGGEGGAAKIGGSFFVYKESVAGCKWVDFAGCVALGGTWVLN